MDVIGESMKPLIVLQTDFSLDWPFVATMKGVIKQIDRELEIIDGSHTITQFSILEGSQQLNYMEPFFPKGTIFVSVVDPGVGTSRKASVAKLKDGNIVITPDNGSLSHVVDSVGVDKIYEISPEYRYQGTEAVSVFHGRDIFGYVAALLASGKVELEKIGKEYAIDDIVLLDPIYLRAKVETKEITGIVSNVSDPFGSIVFNILTQDFNDIGYRMGENIHITLKENDHIYFDQDVYYGDSFGSVGLLEPILFNSSSNYISLGLNQGSFKNQYHIKAGKNFTVEIKEACD